MSKSLIESVLSSKSILVTHADDVTPYHNSPEGFSSLVKGVIKIGDSSDIQAVLALANQCSNTEEEFVVYPISTGNNWGYGSSVPPKDKRTQYLLDLSQLNNILFFDEKSGLCTIQPGVTQEILYNFLKEKSSDYMVPVTGAGPTCSVLANALERGYGITPVADHFSAVTSIKGFLPTGEYYQSGVAEMDKTPEQLADKSFKWKHGPYLDGIFTQSANLVVTEATISLDKAGDGFTSFYMQFFDESSFTDAYEVVSEIFDRVGRNVGSMNLMDKRRVSAMMADNPNGAGSHQNMSLQQIEKISKQKDIPEWTVIGTIYGAKNVSKAVKAEIKKIAKKKASRLFFSNDLLIEIGKLVTNLAPKSILQAPRQQLATLEEGMAIMKGIPNQVALPLAYWRNPATTPDKANRLNPADDGCGLLWYAPLIPTKPASMLSFIDLVRDTCQQYNIEPMITFTNFNQFCTDSTIPIVFDINNPKAKEDAKSCLASLYKKGLKLGFVPYRLNVEQQENLDTSKTFWSTSNKIAYALDPNNILGPGRYAKGR